MPLLLCRDGDGDDVAGADPEGGSKGSGPPLFLQH